MRGRLDDFLSRWDIYRNATKGKVAGVCAGISDRLGVGVWIVRGGFILLAVFFHAIPAAALYLVLALTMRPRHEALGYAVPAGGGGRVFAETPAYCGPAPGARLNELPGARLNELRTRFTAIDARLNRIEAVVTSSEMALRRKFRDLGG